ncbi:MAG: hypothetical protein RJB01_393 [Actinomycetota bacterium]
MSESFAPDEVDQIVAAWRRERPDIDLLPLEVLSRVTRLAQQLAVARSEAFHTHGLDGWEFDVLAALRRSGNPYEMSAGALADATHVTSGTMTNRIDRLSERDLVMRAADPSDRRGVRVILTELGRTTVDGALTELVAREQRVLSAITSAEQLATAATLRTLIQSTGSANGH